MSDNSFQGAPSGASEAAPTAPELEATAASGSAEPTTPAGAEQPEPRTFTQDELNAIVAKEKAKVERQLKRDMEAARQSQPVTVGEPPNPNDFETALEYAEALADHKAAIKLAERDQQQRQQRTNATYAEREEAARDRYEDYETVVYMDDLTITPAMAQVIKASEVGPDVAYYLGKNPKEAERIAGLDPLAQAKELGKIEVKVAGSPPPAKKPSSAPSPINPVGSRTTPTPALDPKDPRSTKSMTTAQWIEARNKQVAERS